MYVKISNMAKTKQKLLCLIISLSSLGFLTLFGYLNKPIPTKQRLISNMQHREYMKQFEEVNVNVFQLSGVDLSDINNNFAIVRRSNNILELNPLEEVGEKSSETKVEFKNHANNETLKEDWSHKRSIRNCITGDLYANFSEYSSLLFSSTEGSHTIETSIQRISSFKKVFNTRAWGHDWDPSHKGLNASGMGATLYWTQEFAATLHVWFNKVKEQRGKTQLRVLDVPCGDFWWMSRFLKTRQDIIYTGIDIVLDLIEHHQKTYENFRRWRFIHGDILQENLSVHGYDVIIIRMMLQHLYFTDIEHILYKVSNSNGAVVIMTTFPRHSKNEDLVIDQENPGRFRFLNLELPPLSLTPPLCLQRDGPLEAFQGWDHFVGVWELPLRKVANCSPKQHYSYHIKETPVDVHTCTKVHGSNYVTID